MLSTKTYLIFNAKQIYWKRTVIALNNRFVAFNASHSVNRIDTNGTKNQYKLSPLVNQLRAYSDQKTTKSSKRVEPLKVSFVEDEPRLTHMERLKRIIQNYGTTAVVLHIIISLTSLGFFYSVVYFGFDITSYINFDKFGERAGKVIAGSGTFAVAYTLHKCIMPARIGVTVILTPVVVGQLRRFGIIKKPHKHM